MIGRYAFLCLLFIPCAITGAAVNPTGFTGYDLVMIVDHSGSMWGSDSHPEPNDIRGHRLGTVQNVLLRLAQHVEDKPYIHRASIVDFASTVQVSLSNYAIRFDPSLPDRGIDRISRFANVYTMPRFDRYYTNTSEAILQTTREFEKMAQDPPFQGRRKVAILITDGRPDMGEGKRPDLMWPEVEAAVRQLQNAGIELWVLGLNDSSEYWNMGDGSRWEALVDTPNEKRASLARQPTDQRIASIVQSIMDDWLDIRSIEVPNDSFVCPPYLRRFTVNVTFEKKRTPDFAVLDPFGQKIEYTFGEDPENPGTFSRLEHNDPAPGTYYIVKDASQHHTVFVEIDYPYVDLIAPGSAVREKLESKIVFQVSDRLRNPIRESTDWPVTPVVLVFGPGPDFTQKTELPTRSIGDGQYEASWIPGQIGSYDAVLRGNVTMPDGTLHDAFDSDSVLNRHRIEVLEVDFRWMKVITPSLTDGFRRDLFSTAVPLVTGLFDENDRLDNDLDRMIGDLSTYFQVETVDPSGVALDGPFPMKPQTDGTFSVDLPMTFDWKRGEGWWREKTVNLRFLRGSTWKSPDAYLNSLKLPPGLEANRIAGDLFSVGPIAAWYPWYFRLSFLILFLIVLMIVIGWLGIRALIKIAIRKEDAAVGKPLELLMYDQFKDPAAVIGGKHTPIAKHKVKLDRWGKVELDDGASIILERLRVVRHVFRGRPEVTLRYKWPKQKRPYITTLAKGRMAKVEGQPAETNYVFKLDYRK